MTAVLPEAAQFDGVKEKKKTWVAQVSLKKMNIKRASEVYSQSRKRKIKNSSLTEQTTSNRDLCPMSQNGEEERKGSKR